MKTLKKAGGFLLDLFDLICDILGMVSAAKKSGSKKKRRK